MYAIQCIAPLHRCIAQHRGAFPSEDSAVHLHQKDMGLSIEDYNVHILDRWFESGVKEAIYVKMQTPSLNSGSLRHPLSSTYNTVMTSFPIHIKPPSKLASCDPNDSHTGRAEELLWVMPWKFEPEELTWKWGGHELHLKMNYTLLVTPIWIHRKS